MLYNRTIRNRTDLLFGSHRRIREFSYSCRLFCIVPLEDRSLFLVCPFYNVYGETTQTRREAIDENNQSVWFVSQTVYDSQGRTTFSVDSHIGGSTAPVWGTQYIYDTQGRTTATVRYKGVQVAVNASGESSLVSTGTEVYRSQTVYNSKGQVYQSIDANGNTTTYEYDSLDRQVATTNSNGLRNETVYNSLGQVIESRIIANGQTKSTFYVYDRFGNVVQTTYPDGTSISATYNDEGQKISETNQLGQTRTFEYSETGQLIAVILPGSLRYEYAYDAQGNQTLIRDPNGHETRFTYDENGNQITRTLPLGFGEDGKQGTEDDSVAEDFTEYFEYDNQGRAIKAISFEGIVTTYSYDDYGRLLSKSFFKNQADFNANSTTEVWSYSYDAYGRTIQVNQNGRLTDTTFTSEGYIASITTPEGTVSYTYDDFGRQTSVSDGENNTAYSYDTIGRLSTVTSEAGTTTYSYDVYGNLAKVVTATGSGIITTTYEYDIMNRLTRLTNFSDSNNNGVMDEGEGVSQFDYTLDALGKKTHATETFWFDNNEDGIKDANVNNIDWTYDQQSRLVREVFDHYDDQFDQTLEWTYDSVGNRLTQNLDKGNDSVIDEVTRYYYDANDRLIDELFDGQNDGTFEKATHYGYDKTQQTAKTVTENGVITSDSTFEYNAVGQMSVVTITKYTDGVASSIERTTYGYGSDGIRVSALHEVDSDADGTYDTATLTEYLNDPNNHTGYSQVLKTTEYSIDGEIRTITKEIYYTIGLDQIAQSVTAYIDGIAQETDHHYFTYDGHGSTRALLDTTAAIIQLYSFDAYGNAIGFNPTDALTEYLYSGEQFDSKIGQQYLRARYYDPATGRFNSLDSFFGNLDDPQSLHKYLYTHADPVNGIDPSGLFSLGGIAFSMGIGGLLGGLSSGGLTLATSGSFALAGRSFVRGMALGALAGALFPLTGAGLLYSSLSFGISKSVSMSIAFWGATLASGVIPSYLSSIWDGNHPLSLQAGIDAGIGGGVSLITAGIFKFSLSRIRAGYAHAAPASEIDDIALQANMARVNEIAHDPSFLKANGLLVNHTAQKEFFDLVEKQLTPALSSKTGPAVGLLNIKQPDGSIKTVLSLALPKNASNSVIRHELTHVARQAAYKSSGNYDLFLYEHQSVKFDPDFWMVFLREESIAHLQTSRLWITGGGL